MCGRYVPPGEADMERFWSIDRRNGNPFDKPRFNVAPTSQVPIIVQAGDGATELLNARWGLVPHWWKKEAPPALTFNARSEEAAQKPTWRESLKSMRCLMPARGWYEWNEHEQVRAESGRTVNRPYFLYCPNSELVAIAGLWSVWERADAQPMTSCALLTKEAAPAIASIHHRMPVILKPDHYAAWMNPRTSAAEVAAMIADARQDLAGYAVSTKVNNARNDFPELLAKAN